MNNQSNNINKTYKAGYEYLLAYKITIPIYDYTVVFCKRAQSPNFPDFPNLSSPRTFDQMVQAARSGTQNIPEGNQQSSLEGYIKLTGVNRASLEELLKDFLAFARQNQIQIWGKVRVEKVVRELGEVWEILKGTPTLPDSPNFPDLPKDLTQAVNLLITLINQAIYLQKRLSQSLEAKFVKEGGFRENLFRKRMEAKKKEFQRGFIKLTKKALITYLIGIFIVSSSGVFYLMNPKHVEAAWFNEDWSYRTSYSLNNTGAAVSSERKIKLDIDTATLITASKLQSDCDDSRFTDQNGKVLEYFIDSDTGACNTNSTDYYIKLSTVPAGRIIIYHYYGNPAADAGTQAAQFSESTFSPASSTAASEEKGNGPIAYWKFDDGTGTTAQDSTTNGLDGTLNNTPTWQTEDMCVSGKCLLFDGANNENVSRADDPKLDFVAADNFTVSAWVKRNGASSANNFILTKAQTGYTGYKLYQDASGDYCFDVSDGTSTDSACTSAVEFDNDQWHLVQGVKTGTTSLTLYIDGRSRATDTSIAATGTLANTGTFYIGVDLDGISNEWLGFIDEVKVYPYARSAVQIAADFASRGNNEGVASIGGNSKNLPGALSNGLVGYWKMDESSGNAADSSGSGYTLTNNNTTSYAAGKYGNGSSFNGTTQYFSTATTISGVQTVAFWVNPASTTNNYINLTGSTVYISSSSGTVSATGVTSPSIYVNGTLNGTLTASSWNHVVITTGTAVSASQLEVGRANSSYLSNTSKMDEIRVYNRALSSAEITSLYNFAPGPVAYYQFDEGSGGNANDISGNGYTATATGTTVTSGKYGKGRTFNGTSDIFTLSSSLSVVSSSNFTVEGWFKSSSTDSNQVIYADRQSASPDRFVLLRLVGATGTVNSQIRVNGGSDITITSTRTGLNDGQWHHAATTRNGANHYLYIDGVLQASSSSVSGTGTAQTAAYIGKLGAGDQYFNGQIDEVKIYNYARTQKQITEDMAGGHPVILSGSEGSSSVAGSRAGGAVGHWKFDEGYGTVANDSAGNSNSLTLSSASWTDSGRFGKAWNGTGALWSSRADDADFDFAAADDGSISLWFKSDSATNPSAAEYLFSKGAGSSAVGYAVYANTAGNICFGVDDDVTWGPDDSACSTGDIYDATWHHIVAMKTGTTKIELYVDGPSNASDTSIAATGTLANSSILYVGDFNGTDNGNEFNGDLDEIKVYRFALTASEVTIDYNRGSAQVLGALGDNSSYQVNAANQEYCIPGDSSTCTAPVGRWDFEEVSGNRNDTSGNGNTLTDNNTVASNPGKYGKAGQFTKTNSEYLSISDNATLSMGDIDFTITAWVYLDTKPSSASHTVLGKWGNAPQQEYILNLEQSTDRFTFYVSSTGSNAVSVAANNLGSPSAKTWYFIAIWHDSSANTINIQVNNGGINSTSHSAGVYNGTTEFDIGRQVAGGHYMDGRIDDVRVYKYVRSAAQIAWDYNRGAPVGWWKFDEGQGGTAYDSSGNSNSGTITIGGTGTQTSAGDINTSSTAWFNGKTGKRNYSLNFDGTDDYVRITDPGPNTGSFTLSVWANASSIGSISSGRGIVGKNKTSGYAYIEQEDSNEPSHPGAIRFLLRNQSGSNIFDLYTINNFVSTNTWYHIVATYDSSSGGTLYIDGTQRASSTSTGSYDFTSGVFDVGELPNGAGRYFAGQIDDVRVYNYALTAKQVQLLYNDGAIRFGPNTGAP